MVRRARFGLALVKAIEDRGTRTRWSILFRVARMLQLKGVRQLPSQDTAFGGNSLVGRKHVGRENGDNNRAKQAGKCSLKSHVYCSQEGTSVTERTSAPSLSALRLRQFRRVLPILGILTMPAWWQMRLHYVSIAADVQPTCVGER